MQPVYRAGIGDRPRGIVRHHTRGGARRRERALGLEHGGEPRSAGDGFRELRGDVQSCKGGHTAKNVVCPAPANGCRTEVVIVRHRDKRLTLGGGQAREHRIAVVRLASRRGSRGASRAASAGRARRCRRRCAAPERLPAATATRPGFSVTSSNRPVSAVPERPKPREARGPRRRLPVRLPDLDQPVRDAAPPLRRAGARGCEAPAGRWIDEVRSGRSRGEARSRGTAPTVCDGVSPRGGQSSCGSSNGVASRPPSTMSQRKPSARSGCVSSRSKLLTRRSRALVPHRVEDRIEREERIAGEVHLRHQALVKARPNSEK